MNKQAIETTRQQAIERVYYPAWLDPMCEYHELCEVCGNEPVEYRNGYRLTIDPIIVTEFYYPRVCAKCYERYWRGR